MIFVVLKKDTYSEETHVTVDLSMPALRDTNMWRFGQIFREHDNAKSILLKQKQCKIVEINIEQSIIV